MRARLMLLAFSWIRACAAIAANQPPSTLRFEWTSPPSSALIGAPIEVSGQAIFPGRYRLDANISGQNLGSFEMLGAQAGAAKTEGEVTVLALRVKIAAFALGEQTFPTLHWTLRAADGSTQTVESPPLRFQIQGPKPEANADIRDIAGPVSARMWPWIVIAILCLLASLSGFYAWKKKTKISAPLSQAVDTRSPDQIALDELEALAHAGLPVKEYYDKISDILRIYLGWRLDLSAINMTTPALIRKLARLTMDPKARSLTKSLLDRCDMAKFARHLPTPEETKRDLETAEQIVRITRPAQPLDPGVSGLNSGIPPQQMGARP